jgi:hypothetical protein
MLALYPARDEAADKGRSHNRVLPLKRFRFAEWLTDRRGSVDQQLRLQQAKLCPFSSAAQTFGQRRPPQTITMDQGID